jgi:hypothetical protein
LKSPCGPRSRFALRRADKLQRLTRFVVDARGLAAGSKPAADLEDGNGAKSIIENVIFLAGRSGRGLLLQWTDADAWPFGPNGANSGPLHLTIQSPL